jgi:hypothetical protein
MTCAVGASAVGPGVGVEPRSTAIEWRGVPGVPALAWS